MHSKKGRYVACSILSLTLIIVSVFSSFARTYKRYSTCESITRELYETVIETLRIHSLEPNTGDMYDTGISCTYDDFLQMKEALEHMFLGSERICYWYNNSQRNDIKIISYEEDKDAGYYYQVVFSGGYHPANTIYVGFFPGTDPVAAMQEHDETMSVITDAIQRAPDGEYEFYSYCADFLKNRCRYDWNYSRNSHFAHAAVCNGSAVCEGIASAYFMMCWLKGRNCCLISNDEHSYNIVRMNGALYITDVTYYICGYDSAFYPANDELVQYIEEPFFGD